MESGSAVCCLVGRGGMELEKGRGGPDAGSRAHERAPSENPRPGNASMSVLQ